MLSLPKHTKEYFFATANISLTLCKEFSRTPSQNVKLSVLAKVVKVFQTISLVVLQLLKTTDDEQHALA